MKRILLSSAIFALLAIMAVFILLGIPLKEGVGISIAIATVTVSIVGVFVDFSALREQQASIKTQTFLAEEGVQIARYDLTRSLQDEKIRLFARAAKALVEGDKIEALHLLDQLARDHAERESAINFLYRSLRSNTRTNVSPREDPIKTWSGIELSTALDVIGKHYDYFKDEGIIFDRCAFRDIELGRGSFSGIQMIESAIVGGYFRNVDLSGGDFSNGFLSDVRFYKCTLKDCIFHKTKFVSVKFEKCSDCLRIDFHGADLQESEFIDCELPSTIFIGVNTSLRKVNFRGSTLEKAKFNFSNASFADFRDCDLRRADFSETNLFGAKFDGASMHGALISEARGLHHGQLQNAKGVDDVLLSPRPLEVKSPYPRELLGSKSDFSGSAVKRERMLDKWALSVFGEDFSKVFGW